MAVAGSCLVEAGWQPTTETARQLIYYCSVIVINYSGPLPAPLRPQCDSCKVGWRGQEGVNGLGFHLSPVDDGGRAGLC